eukprot:8344752-Karenia_brevis.AAC.1
MGISSHTAAQVVAKNVPHRADYSFTFLGEQRASDMRIKCPAIGPPPGDIVNVVAQPALFDWMYVDDINDP